MKNEKYGNILTYLIVIVPIVIYILLIIFSFNTPKMDFETNTPIQNKISNIQNENIYDDTIKNVNTPKKASIIKITLLIMMAFGVPIIIFFLIITGLLYLMKGIYMRALLFNKFGVIRFNNINKITL